MAKNKEMTKVNALTIALELVENSTHAEKDAVATKIRKEIENLSKKSAKASGELTKTQKDNLVLAGQMLDWMESNHAYSICELSKNCPAVLGATPQKIRPLLTGLIKSNAVVRTEEKGKPLFTKVDEE
jgi:hypothetical protein